MNHLNYHNHICGECGLETAHHVFTYESIGDSVEFWCEHCEEDVTGAIGGPV